jgi:DNA invertase Pin-like site-specific DNA recombinase
MQLAEPRDYAQRRGWTVTGEFTDQGVSGSKDSQSQLNRLMAAAHRREFDVILVWKIDRFGRSPKHLVTAPADLAAYGVAFVSLRDNLDLSTPSGRLMFHVIAAMAEFEREQLRERERSGWPTPAARSGMWAAPTSVDSARVQCLRKQGAPGLLVSGMPRTQYQQGNLPNGRL